MKHTIHEDGGLTLELDATDRFALAGALAVAVGATDAIDHHLMQKGTPDADFGAASRFLVSLAKDHLLDGTE